MSELPKGWVETTLGQLLATADVFGDGDWVETKDQDPDGEVRLTQLADIGVGTWRDRSSRFMNADRAQEMGCTFLEPNDVLVARMPQPLGRACLFPGDRRPCVTAVDVCIIRPDAHITSSKWLMWALNSSKARSQVEARQSGSTRKRISRKNLATITLPIAPRPEQDRIVAAIEEHISRLESAEGLLGSAGQRSVSLRAAVIDAIAGTDAEAVLLGEIVDVLDSQRVPVNAKEREARQGDVPYYGATGPVGWIDTPLFNEELVLLGEDGAPFLNRKKPKAYMIRGPAWVNNHAHVLRARSMTSNRFLLHALNSVDYTSYVNGTTRLKLTQVAMREIRLPLPPRSEQDAIVASLEAQLSALNAVATTIDYSLVRSEQLRRSILERAFTGQLVAQDPNDEPASALLARIAAERPATTKPKRKTRA